MPTSDTLQASAAPRQTRPIPENARALILFNEKAGSVGPSDRDKLIEAAKAAGIDEYALVSPENMTEQLFARAKDFDVIIVLGGDGTARSAADLAPKNGPPLVLLPGGTLNILPRALYGERAWPEALAAALERGVVKRLPAGWANKERFYVAALFGAPTMLVHAREAVREGKPVTALKRLRVAWKHMFERSLRARSGKNRMQRVEGLGVLLPSFSGGLEADDLEWVSLDAHNLLEFARVSVRAITDAWRKDPVVEIGRGTTGDVEAAFGYVHATLDGEPKRFYSRVRIKYDPKGPPVLALDQDTEA